LKHSRINKINHKDIEVIGTAVQGCRGYMTPLSDLIFRFGKKDGIFKNGESWG
jgi:hypothetical protein